MADTRPWTRLTRLWTYKSHPELPISLSKHLRTLLNPHSLRRGSESLVIIANIISTPRIVEDWSCIRDRLASSLSGMSRWAWLGWGSVWTNLGTPLPETTGDMQSLTPSIVIFNKMHAHEQLNRRSLPPSEPRSWPMYQGSLESEQFMVN
jgi:hypothetical protein